MSNWLDSALNTFHRSRRKPFFRFGLPFFILVIGGSFGLKQFTSLRYEFQRSGFISNREIEESELKKKEKVTLESEYEKVKEMDIESWENVRGPRPWEDTSALQRMKEERKRQKAAA
ncbi:cytochrome c oxidase assembly protein COX16 homolog, mitochondrial [Centruroides vittatus]|uniref:cytochrome c oxidase assembly protein COX16 homolog, mitochondrial n=1 Tax=Centruroides vittatus TaxID=120091 RepID=UPI003510BE48